MDDDDRTALAEAVAKVIGAVGGLVALVATLFLTVRAFLDDGVGAGLLWLFVFSPLVTLVVYWVTLALVVPITLLLTPRSRRP